MARSAGHHRSRRWHRCEQRTASGSSFCFVAARSGYLLLAGDVRSRHNGGGRSSALPSQSGHTEREKWASLVFAARQKVVPRAKSLPILGIASPIQQLRRKQSKQPGFKPCKVTTTRRTAKQNAACCMRLAPSKAVATQSHSRRKRPRNARNAMQPTTQW